MLTSYIDLLQKNANYRNLWFAAVVSQLGDWLNLIASAALVAGLTDTGTAISYLFLARYLPLFLFSPLAGVLADRYDRRTLLILADLGRAVTVLGFLLIQDRSQVWLFYLLITIQFALSALFTPARSAVLATVVARKDLVTANALDSLTWSTMLALGAALGGLIAAQLGLVAAFVLDSLTFLLSAWFVTRIVSSTQRDISVAARTGWLNFIDGLRYLRGEPIILIFSLVKGGGSLVWGAINVLEVTFAEAVFPLGRDGTATLGLIYAISGLGTGLGPIVLRHWLGDQPQRLRQGISLGFVLLVAGIFLMSQSPNLGWFLSGTLIRTVGSGTVWVFSAAWLQMIVPDKVRGRVFAFEFAFLTLTQSLSIVWAGQAQDNLGLDVRQVTAVMSAAGVLVGSLWFLFDLRRRLAGDPDATAPTEAD